MPPFGESGSASDGGKGKEEGQGWELEFGIQALLFFRFKYCIRICNCQFLGSWRLQQK